MDTSISAWRSLPEPFSPAEPLFVITDLHACSQAMDRLLAQKPADCRLVFLGDAVDRGPDPLGVLAGLMRDPTSVLLRGNHDALAYFAPKNSKVWRVWQHNGARPTLKAFRAQSGEGDQAEQNTVTLPKIFEDYWQKALNWWKSGNLLFVHAGVPEDGITQAWLDMEPSRAVLTEDSPYWWRPYFDRQYYHAPRKIADEELYVVFGHTPLEENLTFMDFGLSLDRGYELKNAAEIRPGKPAQVRIVSTPCDEID